jgi:hypothetical protein
MMRIAIAVAVFVMWRAAVAGAAEAEDPAKDMMCDNAPKGSVVALPNMVSDWVTVLCTPTGQALAPLSAGRMVLWIAQDGKPFMLDAAPRQWSRPDSVTKYEVRFTKFAAVERAGGALENMMKMWDLSFRPEVRPQIDRVVQLDAMSIWQGTIYNLFFYVSGNRPKWLIVCINQCKSSVSIRVVDQ